MSTLVCRYLFCFYFLFQQLHESCVWKIKVSRNANVPPRHFDTLSCNDSSVQEQYMYFLNINTMHESEVLAYKSCRNRIHKRLTPGKSSRVNACFIFNSILCFAIVLFATWLNILLSNCGDIHPNLGPLSTSSSSSTYSSSSSKSNTLFSPLDLTHNLSFVHYNVQSIFSKLEILQAALFKFDILAFTETWLNPSVDTDELLMHSYSTPERKDRAGDTHGGVMIYYVKDCLHYKRREDLEPRNIENIWLELTNNHKHVSFGLFYRPPKP